MSRGNQCSVVTSNVDFSRPWDCTNVDLGAWRYNERSVVISSVDVRASESNKFFVRCRCVGNSVTTPV